jgi:hypothetical protein
MREHDGGNGESRKQARYTPLFDPALASCDGPDFSLQVVSEVFVGKVRS